eukprot:SAG11_NODE_6959_length_1219_cov_1.322321_2_plen_118_part_00
MCATLRNRLFSLHPCAPSAVACRVCSIRFLNGAQAESPSSFRFVLRTQYPLESISANTGMVRLAALDALEPKLLSALTTDEDVAAGSVLAALARSVVLLHNDAMMRLVVHYFACVSV